LSKTKELIDKLEQERTLSKEEFMFLIDNYTEEDRQYAAGKANAVREKYYRRDVYLRGLIEFTNYCRNDCLYCGIRRSNPNAERYRLTEEEILGCCDKGYELGFRTFVLQGGEDAWFTDERLVQIIRQIKQNHDDCAVTLSIGERSRESYQKLYDAGADRYLLRHETANEEHYGMLHPAELSLKNRKQCLWNLKEIGYQVGAGFMVGSPYQTSAYIAEDMLFLKELEPDMVGIGPFIPHHDTPFRDKKAGTAEFTIFLMSLLRLMLPKVLLPATTALGTVSGDGRERGILAGGNVVMPNLSPGGVRGKYLLYDNKICTGDEAAECMACMSRRMERIGYHVKVSRGDAAGFIRH